MRRPYLQLPHLVSGEMNAIFGTFQIEGVTTKERAIYINESRRDNYSVILTSPRSSPSRPIYFSETDAYNVHLPHNDT